MDELRIYDEALDAGQVRNLYAYNDVETPEVPVLKVDFGGFYPDGGVGPYQYVTPGWRGMTASCLERSGPVTDTFGYGDGEVTLTVDSTQEGGPNWQNRSRPTTSWNCYINHPIGDVANDFVFCGTEGVMELTLEGLPAGEHYIRTYHHDTNTNYGSVSVSLTDANGADRMINPGQPISYGGGNSAANNDPDPGIISTLPMKVVSDGTNPVVISVAPSPRYAHVSGLEITASLPTDLKVDFQAGSGDTQDGFQSFAFPGTDPNPNGAQRMWYFSEIGRAGSASVTVSRSDTSMNLNFRDRAQVSSNADADLMEDFVCAGSDLTVTLGNLKPGTYQVTNTYHDVTAARGLVDITVLDKQGERTVASAINQTGGDITTAPASATFQIETDGLLPVDITTLGSVITQNSIEIERVGEGPEGPFPLKIYLIGGQSNGDGRGSISALSPEMSAKIGIPTYHRDGWKHLQPGLDHMSDQMHGVEISFGREMAELLPGENVAVIKYAYSSTDLANDWNPETGSHYETFMNTIEAALAALPEEYVPEIEGMLWIQGESDSTDLAEANAYETNLNDFIATLRTELDSPDMAFVMSELADIPRWTYGDTVRAAEAAVAAGDSLTSLVAVDDLPFNTDGYHYSSAGLITLGERMAQEMVALTEGEITLDGDLNNDGHVNSGDLDLVRANWGASGAPGIEGDANDDGYVNSNDLDIIRANWGQSLVAVPEPGVACLLVVGLLLMGMKRRS